MPRQCINRLLIVAVWLLVAAANAQSDFCGNSPYISKIHPGFQWMMYWNQPGWQFSLNCLRFQNLDHSNMTGWQLALPDVFLSCMTAAGDGNLTILDRFDQWYLPSMYKTYTCPFYGYFALSVVYRAGPAATMYYSASGTAGASNVHLPLTSATQPKRIHTPANKVSDFACQPDLLFAFFDDATDYGQAELAYWPSAQPSKKLNLTCVNAVLNGTSTAIELYIGCDYQGANTTILAKLNSMAVQGTGKEFTCPFPGWFAVFARLLSGRAAVGRIGIAGTLSP